MHIEQSRDIFKNILINAANYVCGVSKKSNRKKQTCWWSDKIKQQTKKETYLDHKAEISKTTRLGRNTGKIEKILRKSTNDK